MSASHHTGTGPVVAAGAAADGVVESGAVVKGASVQVLPSSSEGGRPVVLGNVALGVAYGPAEVDILRQAGIEDSVIALDDRKVIEWQGGGPEVWD